MPVRMVGGRLVRVPEAEDGRVDAGELRRVLGSRPGRAIIEQRPTGENVYLPAEGRVSISPDSWLLDAPRAERG